MDSLDFGFSCKFGGRGWLGAIPLLDHTQVELFEEYVLGKVKKCKRFQCQRQCCDNADASDQIGVATHLGV